jgi:hypothetical protein
MVIFICVAAMLMPRALYVGTAVSHPHLPDYDSKYHLTTYDQQMAPIDIFYHPSLRAIK